MLTAQSRPSPLNGPLSLAIECCGPAPWRRPATAISGEAGMRRAGLRQGVGAPVLTPAATQADSIGIYTIPVSSGQQMRGRVHTTKSWNVLQPIGHDFLAPNLKKQNLLFRAFGIYNCRRESVDARHFLQTTPQIRSGCPQAPSHASLADYMLFLIISFFKGVTSSNGLQTAKQPSCPRQATLRCCEWPSKAMPTTSH